MGNQGSTDRNTGSAGMGGFICGSSSGVRTGGKTSKKSGKNGDVIKSKVL
jgi:hypothetical protein